jgi:monoamine oxidase
MEFHTIIVGGGIAGLYSAYLLSKRNTGNTGNNNILLIEKNNYLGGRMGSEMFEGQSIVTGAGIGRKHKDLLLLKLLHELKIKYHEFPVVMKCAPSITNPISINDTHELLKKYTVFIVQIILHLKILQNLY